MLQLSSSPVDALVPIVELRTYFVEDNATIRENLIGTLEELASIKALGWGRIGGRGQEVADPE